MLDREKRLRRVAWLLRLCLTLPVGDPLRELREPELVTRMLIHHEHLRARPDQRPN